MFQFMLSAIRSLGTNGAEVVVVVVVASLGLDVVVVVVVTV